MPPTNKLFPRLPYNQTPHGLQHNELLTPLPKYTHTDLSGRPIFNLSISSYIRGNVEYITINGQAIGKYRKKTTPTQNRYSYYT